MEEKKCPKCGGKMMAYSHLDPDICENELRYVCEACEKKQEEYEKKYKKIICQSCGAEAIPQSDVVLNGSDNMWSCPNCKERWVSEEDLTENSLPLAYELSKMP